LLAVALVAALLPTFPALAGDLEDGEAAYNRWDYVEALRLLRPLAERGNAEAQLKLGYIYEGEEESRDPFTDYEEAAKWLRRAADQGNPEAQTELGAIPSYSALRRG